MTSNSLIVKTSSLGDIIQALAVLDLFEGAVDWVVDQRFAALVAAHPRVRTAIAVELGSLSGWRRALGTLRRQTYDVVFDLQGNAKSGVLTRAARAPVRVGFGPRSVREWPNLLATNQRYEVEQSLNIRSQYRSLIEQHLGISQPAAPQGVRLALDSAEQERLTALLRDPRLAAPVRAMVCPGSKWVNKQLTPAAWAKFLERLHAELDVACLLMWGTESERALCEELARGAPRRSVVVERLSITAWQNLMTRVDVVVAVDSAALHLAGTTATPTFSVFGPTAPEVFKPLGEHHFALQGACPYALRFTKQCPRLRSCPTGACIRELAGDALFEAFRKWWSAKEVAHVF